jgi:hypothetical protein
MLRQPTALLLAATSLAEAATASTYNLAAVGAGSQAAARHVVVRTELVHSPDGGFDWLDAGAGFGFAVVSAAVVLLVVGAVRGRRARSRPAKSAS